MQSGGCEMSVFGICHWTCLLSRCFSALHNFPIPLFPPELNTTLCLRFTTPKENCKIYKHEIKDRNADLIDRFNLHHMFVHVDAGRWTLDAGRWSSRLETGPVFQGRAFSLRGSCAGCSFVSQSQSIHTALYLHHRCSAGTQGEKERSSICVCMCVCVNVPEEAWRKICCVHIVCLFLCVCVCLHAPRSFACVETLLCVCLCVCAVWVCVWAATLCGILLLSNRHPSVCYLSKLKAPALFWGASGRKRNNWAITLLLLSSQRCSAPPCLASLPGGLCCEAFPFLPIRGFIYPCFSL